MEQVGRILAGLRGVQDLHPTFQLVAVDPRKGIVQYRDKSWNVFNIRRSSNGDLRICFRNPGAPFLPEEKYNELLRLANIDLRQMEDSERDFERRHIPERSLRAPAEQLSLLD